jgi:broad specificity phosphatase PhoE
MTIYLIRHAHKQKGNFYNPYLRHQDEPISPHGQEQARRLWTYLSDKRISAIYVSAYQRTLQTIEYAATQLGIRPLVDERLNEIDNGCFERMSEVEIQVRYPEIWKAYRERKGDFRFPEGETGQEASQRIADFLEEKRQAHQNENIVAVSHEGLIRLIACHILGLPVYKRWNLHSVDFCGVVEINHQPEYQSWQLIRFNQILS